MASAWLLLAFSLAAAQSFDQLTPGVLEPALELPQLPKTNSTLNLTCFGWRLLAPELILTSGGALHFGERITEEELLSIRHVSADLIVTDDWFLTNLDLLAGLESVGGNVEIRWNERLRDISGLSNIRVIGGTMNIMFNPSLSDMPGFTQLEVVGRSLKILHNTALVSITGFPALARIGRDFTLIGNEKLLSAPRMPSLRAVDGSIEVVYNRALHSLDDMVVALERVEGNFIIKDNDNLTKITVLPTIQSIGQLTISFNNAITEVHGLPYLEQMGSLTISGNKMLEKIEGFPTLQLLKGQFRVSHNKQLQSLSFGNLTTIEGNLDLLDNDNLTTAEFLSLHTVSGNVQVGYNRQLVRFSSSMVFAQKIEFLANYELREVLLPNLSIVTGDSKAAVSGDLRISFNFQLEEVAGFEKLKQVSGDLEILANSKLRDVSAFSRLALIGGSLIVKNNTVLEDMSGFSSDLTVQNLQIQDNQQLKGISGLSTLPTVRGYAVLGINCTGNYVLRPQAVVCSACKPWEVPSLDKTTCQLDYYFIFVVGLACVLSFCLAFALFMTVRTVMVVDNIIITAAGRVVLRTTERHYLLRGFWGRSFPLKLEGTGCQFLECQPIVRARAVSDTELELLVKMERCRSPRRTMSSLPMSEMVESPKNAQISMNFKGLDSSPAGMEPPAAGSCLLSCQGFAHVRSPWELLAAGLSLPTLVWACMFLIAIAALVYLGMSSGIRPEATLVPALQSFGIGAACALLLRLLAVLRRQGQRRLRARQLREVQLLAELEKACWEGSSERILKLQKELAARGWSHQRFSSTLQGVRKRQSEEAGVSVAFLLSEEFLDLAQGRSRMENPNFYDLKDAFFLREEPIGRDLLCPRDGMPGCALVDVVDQRHRRQCTHFLSWAWSYSVTLVRSALRSWMDQSKLVPGTTFLYMCFFVNNQYRILLDHEGAGSRDWSLGEVFEENLQRIGRMVALLDHWDQPAYLSRIWTIFEQYSAVVLEIEVTFILPQTSGDSLLQEIRKGEEGILQVRESLCNVDAETAGAWCAEDEKMVKRLIEQTIGFEKVNEKVQELMIAWVATMVKDYLGNLVVMGTRRLQRLKAQSFLSANATEWTHKMSTRTDASATLQTVKMKSHNSPIWTRYLNEDTQVSVFKSPSRR